MCLYVIDGWKNVLYVSRLKNNAWNLILGIVYSIKCALWTKSVATEKNHSCYLIVCEQRIYEHQLLEGVSTQSPKGRQMPEK